MTCGSTVSVGGESQTPNDRSSEEWKKTLTLVDHRLDDLMHMVVIVLASHHRDSLLGPMTLNPLNMITEFGLLSIQATLDLLTVIVLEGAALHREDVLMVLLLDSLLIGDWLDGSVVVVLVELTVDSSGLLFPCVVGNGGMVDGWADEFVNCRVMMPVLGPGLRQQEVGEVTGLSGLHEFSDRVLCSGHGCLGLGGYHVYGCRRT